MSYVYVVVIIISILLILIPLIYYNVSGKSYWYNWVILAVGIILLLLAIFLHVLYRTYQVGKSTIEKGGKIEEVISDKAIQNAPLIISAL